MREKLHWSGRSLLYKIGFCIVAGFGFLLALVILIVIGLFTNYKVAQNSQKSKYDEAVTVCGEQPVVVVKSQALADTRLEIYSPGQPSYDAMKTVVVRPFDILGGNQVVGYYCSAEEAQAAHSL
jgi:hypothetical protein